MIKLTKNQAIILSIFFANIGKSFYLRELARMISKDPGVFQRDINNLEKQGILISEFKGKNRYFKLNKNYPLYQEIKQIIYKTTGLEKVLEKELKNMPTVQNAFIYGSFANNTADETSDIDLIIVGNPDQEKLDKIMKQIEKKYNREINYNLYSLAEFTKKKNKDSFLKEILTNKIIKLI